MPGLGFDFWYPTIPTEIGKIVPDSPAARADLHVGATSSPRSHGQAVADFRRS
jgi:hypothetical protein